MLFDDGGGKNAGKSVTGETREKAQEKTDETEETLDEVFEKISQRVFSKYSSKENRVISKGKSIFDVAQDKLIELWKRSIKPQADIKENLKWIDRNISQGERKLYKYSNNIDSLDNKNLNLKYFSRQSKKQGKLEKYQIIEKVFNGYEPRDRLIIELRLFAKSSYEEIAKAADTTEGNARKIVCEFKKDCSRFGLKNS
jgi:DNA-directed RNA polymerase specialized sigma24 family protein